MQVVSDKKDEKLAFGRRLRQWRMDAGLERAEVARMMGVREKTIQNVELGQQRLGGAAMAALDRLMVGGASAVGAAESAGRRLAGGLPAGVSTTPAVIAGLIEDAARIEEQAAQVSALLGVPHRTALEHVIAMRLGAAPVPPS